MYCALKLPGKLVRCGASFRAGTKGVLSAVPIRTVLVQHKHVTRHYCYYHSTIILLYCPRTILKSCPIDTGRTGTPNAPVQRAPARSTERLLARQTHQLCMLVFTLNAGLHRPKAFLVLLRMDSTAGLLRSSSTTIYTIHTIRFEFALCRTPVPFGGDCPTGCFKRRLLLSLGRSLS